MQNNSVLIHNKWVFFDRVEEKILFGKMIHNEIKCLEA